MASSSSSATDASDCFYTAKVAFKFDLSLTNEVSLNLEETATAGKSEYYSSRCEAMMQSRGQFSDDVEFDIKHSKSHWSEVKRLVPFSQEDVEQDRENMKVFEELQMDPECGGFFRFTSWNCPGLGSLGRMIAKGGHAEIFEVKDSNLLMKVFPRGTSLFQLLQFWPLQILKEEVQKCIIWGGLMLEDGRFAFLMNKCWGDLRKLSSSLTWLWNPRGAKASKVHHSPTLGLDRLCMVKTSFQILQIGWRSYMRRALFTGT